MSDPSANRGLYPPIEPFNVGRLRVSSVHEIYFEQCGNPEGQPILFIHGGPGGGTNPKQRRFFDPERYHIVLFDQRGCGKSTPHASLEENTTWHLVSDMELLRSHLGLSSWVLFGGSWGTALALAYSETNPSPVDALILRGIFLLRKTELYWFYQDGANRLFPDYWEDFIAPIPPGARADFISAYYSLLNADEETALRAARAWTTWEKRTSTLVVDREAVKKVDDDLYSLAFARIECHYFVNGGFFTPEDQILKKLDTIRAIPTTIVQGRYDVVCPMQTAWELARRWPEADLRIVDTAGHSQFERGIVQELVHATDRHADRLLDS